jgi:hypothetical protein
MRTVTVLGLGLLGLLFALPAQALTISNTDAEPRTLTVTAGGNSAELTIEPQASVEPPCESGCTIALDSGEKYEMEGGDQAAIEDGNIFVDTVPAREQ